MCANHALSSRIKSIEGVQVNQNSISPVLPFLYCLPDNVSVSEDLFTHLTKTVTSQTVV